MTCFRALCLSLVHLALAASVAFTTAHADPVDPPQCDHDLELVIKWTGEAWAITSSSAAYPAFEACRGRSVAWTLGATPPGSRDRVLAWTHIAPTFFEADSTLGASTGFASVSASKAVTLRIREDVPPEHLYYAVLVLNVTDLNPGLLKQLEKDLRGRRYGQARRFSPLTFVQQGSPPKMVIR